MTASEEERKVNVDRATRAFTDNTLFAPTHHGIVPETAATCEDTMATEDDHPASFCMRVKLSKRKPMGTWRTL